MMVFFWTRLRKILIWQQFSGIWESDFKTKPVELSRIRGIRHTKKHNLGTGFFILQFLKLKQIFPKLHWFSDKISTHFKTIPGQ